MASASSWGIAVDATDAYWTGGGKVWRCALKGCGGVPTVVASGYSSNLYAMIAVDQSAIYWTEYVDGLIVKLPK
jgi:hypothetical protein